MTSSSSSDELEAVALELVAVPDELEAMALELEAVADSYFDLHKKQLEPVLIGSHKRNLTPKMSSLFGPHARQQPKANK